MQSKSDGGSLRNVGRGRLLSLLQQQQQQQQQQQSKRTDTFEEN